MNWTERRERLRAHRRRQALHLSGIGVRRHFGADRRRPRLRSDDVRGLGRLVQRVGGARSLRADAHRVRRSRPTASTAPARCRSASTPTTATATRCQRQAHGRGAGDRRRLGADHRGHAVADAVRRRRRAAHLDRGRRRQDARGAGRPAGPAPGHRRPHQRHRHHRSRTTPSRGSRPTRRWASTCCSWRD